MKSHVNCILLLMLFLPAYVTADSSESDCNQSDINYVEKPGMTRAERLEAMNRAFFESVNRFDECNLSVSTSSSSSNSSSANAATEASNDSISGTEGSETEPQSAQSQESIASTGLSGTEAESVDAEAVAESLDSLANETESTITNEQIAHSGPAGQGKTPEDIPDANNDDVVAAQIRLAAEIETDPEKKEKLWNEYRKYKGLPTQP